MDPERFLDLFERAARQAGAVALHLRGHVGNVGKDVGGSPESTALTAVDLATQDLLLLRLLDEDGDVAVDAEEDTRLVDRFPPAAPGRPIVVLDPIDGTLNYVRGHDDFAVMGSLLRDGRHEAALIHFPVADATWWAIRGGGTWVRRGDGAPERVWRPRADDRLLVSPGASRHWAALGDLRLEREICRCSAVFSSAPALGRAQVAVSSPFPDRRAAIGFLLTTESGGVVRLGGRPWTDEDPLLRPLGDGPTIIAASATLADRVEDALAART